MPLGVFFAVAVCGTSNERFPESKALEVHRYYLKETGENLKSNSKKGDAKRWPNRLSLLSNNRRNTTDLDFS